MDEIIAIPPTAWTGALHYLVSLVGHKRPLWQEKLLGKLLSAYSSDPYALLFALHSTHGNYTDKFKALSSKFLPRCHVEIGAVQEFCASLSRAAVLEEERWHGIFLEVYTLFKSNLKSTHAYLKMLNDDFRGSVEPGFVREEYNSATTAVLKLLEAHLAMLRKYGQVNQNTFHKYIEDSILKLLDVLIVSEGNIADLSSLHATWRDTIKSLDASSKQMKIISLKLNGIGKSTPKGFSLPLNAGSYDNPYLSVELIFEQAHVINSKAKPKKIKILSTEGEEHDFILKGQEDLRKDLCISLLFSHVQELQHLSGRYEHCELALGIKPLLALPISPTCGIISWINDCVSLYDMYSDRVNAGARVDRGNFMDPVQKYFQHLKAFKVDPKQNRATWPKEILLEVFENLSNEVDASFISCHLVKTASSARQLFESQRIFNRSMAIMSHLGHIVGLGDRHLSNILLEEKSGQLIHVDYAVILDRGERLAVSENVPFRLTQGMIHSLGHLGLHCGLKSIMAKSVKSLKEISIYLNDVMDLNLENKSIHWAPDCQQQFAKVKICYTIEMSCILKTFENIEPRSFLKWSGRFEKTKECLNSYLDIFMSLQESYSNIDEIATIPEKIAGLKKYGDQLRHFDGLIESLETEKEKVLKNINLLEDALTSQIKTEDNILEILADGISIQEMLNNLRVWDMNYFPVPVSVVDEANFNDRSMITHTLGITADYSPLSDSQLFEASLLDAKLVSCCEMV